MDKNNFLSLITHNEVNFPNARNLVEEIIESFPYCQISRILITRLLHEEHDAQFNKALKLAAIYAPDRKHLYYYIMQPILAKVIDECEGIDRETYPDNRKHTGSALLTDDEKTKLEKEIMHEALTSTLVDEIAKKPVIKQEKEHRKIRIQKAANPNVDTILEGKRPFSQWLNTLEQPGYITKVTRDDTTFNKQEDTSFYSPVNMARLSIIEDEEFITETLAKIYIKQKHYNKAIKAYSNLSLKNPEKRSYFAARIKELEEIIKKDK